MSESKNLIYLNEILNNFSTGNKIESFKDLKKFVETYPDIEIANYNYAYMCEQFNQIDKAVSIYKKIIYNNESNWRSRFNLYLIYINQKKYKEALKLVNEVLNIKNNYQPALRDKALILFYSGKLEESLKYIKMSIAQNNVDYIALNTLGLIYMAMKMFEDANKVFNEAIRINDKYISSYNNLGKCYLLQKNRQSSISCFEKALKINPNSKESLNNIASYYSETGSYQKALDYYFRALDKNNHEILYNIAIAYAHLNQDKLSKEYYDKAMTIDPNDEKLQKNYSMLLLKLQKYKKAWELFEGRLGLQEFNLKNSFIDNIKKKLWRSEKINNNEKLLVIKEQGVGDEILNASMYPDFISKYPNSFIETDSRLISLFKRSFKDKEKFVNYSFFSKEEKSLEKFSKVIYAGSLGRLFRNNLSDFPKTEFLKADNNLLDIFNKKIKIIDNNLKFGISWNSTNKLYGLDKSLKLNQLIPILKMKGITFINLQYGETDTEIKHIFEKHNIDIKNIKDLDLYNDFESTSALLKNLDLLISVSNSTVHLAAALGVETWVIKPKNHAVFHYWNQPNNTSPWYPSVKLFDHKENWDETINNIKKEIIKNFNLKS